MSPSIVIAKVGQGFSTNVNFSDVLDLYEWEFRLKWNATLFSSVGALQGSFLESRVGTSFSYNDSLVGSVGSIVVDCTLLGGVSGAGGEGTSATIVFYVKGPGECPLMCIK